MEQNWDKFWHSVISEPRKLAIKHDSNGRKMMRYPHNTSSLHANSIITIITLNDDDDDDYYYCNKIKQCPIMIILLIFFIKEAYFFKI